MFERAYSGAPWEAKAGYCRAIRAGPYIHVTGTAPVAPDGSVTAPGDAYAQARRCFEIIAENLAKPNADLAHWVRTRMYVIDISRWTEFARAHRECFAEHPPATTLVEISRLIDPEMLREVEADAYCPAHAGGEPQ